MRRLKNKITDLVDDPELEDPKYVFIDILMDIVNEVVKTDKDRLHQVYNSETDIYYGSTMIDKMQTSLPDPFSKAKYQVRIFYLPNTICPQVKHLPVLN